MRKMVVMLMLLACSCVHAQQARTGLWHNKERDVRYYPDGQDFIIQNGDRRFNRALYGTNTGFRVEAGDLPEFAMYLPGMGGNIKLGIVKGAQSKWLIHAQKIEARYRPGSMIYTIRDPLLSEGTLIITILALHGREGLIVKIENVNVSKDVQLVIAYGGANGARFSRNGDIGADPESSFDLKPENCTTNVYSINENTFEMSFGASNARTSVSGVFPARTILKMADAFKQTAPSALLGSAGTSAPVIAASISLEKDPVHFVISISAQPAADTSMLSLFEQAETARKKLAGRIKLNTPDPHLNTLGGALSIAADAIWEDPTYLHGAVAWRMRLNAWRGAYVADPLGWHDRARKHFSSYALSQVTTPPETGVVMDTAFNLARHLEKIGTALFSNGYICRNPNGDIRAHHYDMNLVFVDQLLNHFNWTGDTAYVREMWPLIKRHLAWEKRNFDADGDGLYDAYAAIWASDALQYSGGGVTHTSFYNCRANYTASMLAKLIGEDGAPYLEETHKIIKAINKNLWLPEQGTFAEYKDLLGKKLVHPTPGLWTIYHAMDSRLVDGFQAFQSLRYVDTEIPHIPVRAQQWEDTSMYLLSTSNWQPYTWSINNVALAENLHTALAYWQGNRNEEAYTLWRSTLLESMYLGASPGGFAQLSFYDAIRGELYRDFADGLGMAARTLVEGLFGVLPEALNNRLHIKPGLPKQWDFASLELPHIQIDFKRKDNTERYYIRQSFRKLMQLDLEIPALMDSVASVTVNGNTVKWHNGAVTGKPTLHIRVPPQAAYDIVVQWKGNAIDVLKYKDTLNVGGTLRIATGKMQVQMVNDPQQLFYKVRGVEQFDMNLQKPGAADESGYSFRNISASSGNKTFFMYVNQGEFEWWLPVYLTIPSQKKEVPKPVITSTTRFEKISLNKYFNDKVTNIFRQRYLSPRPASPTLQLPAQGIGNWCYPLTTANISDSGMRINARRNNEIRTMQNVPFSTPADTLLNNIIYTSQWDNYPVSATVPLSGKASFAYLLMAGSTNPMQSRITNGMITVQYTDGSYDTLLLRNPENWWPIEQDYYIDGYAFTTGAPHPERLYFKEGKFGKGLPAYTSIRGFSNRAIDGGAGTVLNMPLNKNKPLRSLTVHAIANDVVIGLMAVTLIR